VAVFAFVSHICAIQNKDDGESAHLRTTADESTFAQAGQIAGGHCSRCRTSQKWPNHLPAVDRFQRFSASPLWRLYAALL